MWVSVIVFEAMQLDGKMAARMCRVCKSWRHHVLRSPRYRDMIASHYCYAPILIEEVSQSPVSRIKTSYAINDRHASPILRQKLAAMGRVLNGYFLNPLSFCLNDENVYVFVYLLQNFKQLSVEVKAFLESINEETGVSWKLVQIPPHKRQPHFEYTGIWTWCVCVRIRIPGSFNYDQKWMRNLNVVKID